MKNYYFRFIISVLVCFLSCTMIAFSQQDTTQSYQPYRERDESKVPFGERLIWGGNFGLQFGSVTIIDIEPILGYKITPQLIGGFGVKYIYYEYKYIIGNYIFESSTNIYGGSLFSRYYLTENFFGHLEYEVINLEVPDDFNYPEFIRTNITSVFVGGGYSQQIGEHAALGISILYNLTEENYTPYQNPIIRVGFGFGF